MNDLGNKGKNSSIKNIGLDNVANAYWNLTPAELVEDSILLGEGVLTDTGALISALGPLCPVFFSNVNIVFIKYLRYWVLSVNFVPSGATYPPPAVCLFSKIIFSPPIIHFFCKYFISSPSSNFLISFVLIELKYIQAHLQIT